MKSGTSFLSKFKYLFTTIDDFLDESIKKEDIIHNRAKEIGEYGLCLKLDFRS